MIFFVYRAIPWWEAIATGLGMAYLQPVFMSLGLKRRDAADSEKGSCFSWKEGLCNCIFLGLSVAGAAVSTISEWQRRAYLTEHPGSLFVGGLFSYARHINYTGEVLLFTGWAAWTRTWRAMLVPIFFAATFMLFYIPDLDSHLLRKHGHAFADYQRDTPSLIPAFADRVSESL